MRNIIMFWLMLLSSLSFAETADDIIIKSDLNETFTTFKGKGKVIIEGKYGKRESSYFAYSMGSENSLIEFTSGEEEGQKVFKTPEDLYIWYPYAEEIQRLSRKKTLGAVSYDEMSGEKNTLKDYSAKLLGEENIEGKEVYKIELIAKTSKVPHYKQVVFIGKDNYVVLKAEYYSKSGKLTKEMRVLELEKSNGYTVPTHSIVVDRLKKNNSTENIIISFEINTDLNEDLFSLGELSW